MHTHTFFSCLLSRCANDILWKRARGFGLGFLLTVVVCFVLEVNQFTSMEHFDCIQPFAIENRY